MLLPAQASGLYKDKAVSSSSPSALLNTHKTRVALFLVTITLLVVYSINSLQNNNLSASRVISRVTAQQAKTTPSITRSSYHDADFDFNKIGKAPKETVNKNNNGVEETIDTTLDAKVVGSIVKGATKEEQELGEDAKARGFKALQELGVQADVTRAYRDQAKLYESQKKAAEEKATEEKPILKDTKKVTDKKVEPLELKKDTKSLKKAVVEQYNHGGVRVLDRIDMSG